MLRLSKKENYREAIIIGSVTMFVGAVFTFYGATFLSLLFSIICSLALGALFTAFLCLVFDVEWDSEAGIGITSGAMLLSSPFVGFALQFADIYAVPAITALCTGAVAEMIFTLIGIDDDPLPFKSCAMIASFIAGFYFAMKIQDTIRVAITCLYGGILMTLGGTIVFNKYPDTLKNK